MNPDSRTTHDRTARGPVPNSLRADERGVSEVLGAVLIFGLLVALLVLVQVTAVPTWNQQTEYEHSLRVQADFQFVADASSRVLAAGGEELVSVETGLTYPQRAFLFNPPPVTGTVRTTDPALIRLANVAAPGEAGDYWTGDEWSISTRALVYEPAYRQYQNAPVSVFENGLVFNEYASADILAQQRSFVEGRTVTIVALGGDLRSTRVDPTSVTLTGVSAPATTLTVSDDGQPITVSVPTRLSESRWRELLATELRANDPDGNVVGFGYDDAAPGDVATLTLELDPAFEYDLRLARLHVGPGDPHTPAAYVTHADGQGGSVGLGERRSLTFTVRDAYNNPVSGEPVAFTLSGGGSLSATAATTDADGRVTVTYTAPNVDASATVVAAIHGSSAAEPNPETASISLDSSAPDFELPPEIGGQINPNYEGAVVLYGADLGDCSNPPSKQGCGYLNVTLQNLNDNRTKSITEFRATFYSTGPNNPSVAVGGPATVVVADTVPGDATAYTLPVGGWYQSTPDLAAVPADDGLRTYQLTFERADGTEYRSFPGDFIVLSVIFDDRTTATYFVPARTG